MSDDRLLEIHKKKNRENGLTIHSQVADAVRRFLSSQDRDEHNIMQVLKATYYEDAILRNLIAWTE